MQKHILITLIASALLVGCSTPSGPQPPPKGVVLYNDAQRTPTTGIDVFREGVKPTKPYKEIAEISEDDFAWQEARARNKIIAKAKAIGANGLMMLPPQKLGYEWVPFSRSGDKYSWKAIAIAYE